MTLVTQLVALGAAAAAGALVVPVGLANSSNCPVSKLAPLESRPEFEVGTARLAVSLPERATFVAVPEGRPGGAWLEADGSVRTKVGWLSPRGRPRVNGRRVDGPAPPLDAHVGVKSFAQGSGYFYPSTLRFPAVGCWRITAGNSDTSLVVTVRVIVARSVLRGSGGGE